MCRFYDLCLLVCGIDLKEEESAGCFKVDTINCYVGYNLVHHVWYKRLKDCLFFQVKLNCESVNRLS